MSYPARQMDGSAAVRAERQTAEAHSSMILRLFCEDVQARPRAKVLDVGPVCGDNISLFAERVRSLYIYDLFSGLVHTRNSGESASRVWGEMAYPPDTFDGLLLWDLIDRLDDGEIEQLLEKVHQILKPDGLLVVFACGEHEAGQTVHNFVLGTDYTVYQRRQEQLSLPRFPRQNREMLDLLQSFAAVKSVIYRNGVREFLLRPA